MIDFTPDLRRRRAEELIHALMAKIEPYLNDTDTARRDAYYALFEALYDMGIDIVTDYHRRECGLPPRNEKGWTAWELAAMELRRLEFLSRPLTLIIPDPT